MGKIVTDDMKSEMKRLYDIGLSHANIAKEFGIAEDTVRYWLLSENKRETVKGIARQRLSEYLDKRQLLKERKCPHCNIIKPTADFYKSGSYCKDCRKEYGRAYNKTFHRSVKLKAADKVRRKIKKKEIAQFLGGKCNDCGISLTDENLCIFDLHHKNLLDKEPTNGRGDEDWRSPKMMQKIIDGKIMLLCSNCHRMVHHKNGDSLYCTPKKLLPKIMKDKNEPKYQNFIKSEIKL